MLRNYADGVTPTPTTAGVSCTREGMRGSIDRQIARPDSASCGALRQVPAGLWCILWRWREMEPAYSDGVR